MPLWRLEQSYQFNVMHYAGTRAACDGHHYSNLLAPWPEMMICSGPAPITGVQCKFNELHTNCLHACLTGPQLSVHVMGYQGNAS